MCKASICFVGSYCFIVSESSVCWPNVVVHSIDPIVGFSLFIVMFCESVFYIVKRRVSAEMCFVELLKIELLLWKRTKRFERYASTHIFESTPLLLFKNWNIIVSGCCHSKEDSYEGNIKSEHNFAVGMLRLKLACSAHSTHFFFIRK